MRLGGGGYVLRYYSVTNVPGGCFVAIGGGGGKFCNDFVRFWGTFCDATHVNVHVKNFKITDLNNDGVHIITGCAGTEACGYCCSFKRYCDIRDTHFSRDLYTSFYFSSCSNATL